LIRTARAGRLAGQEKRQQQEFSAFAQKHPKGQECCVRADFESGVRC
jgi:hypothetical protein